MRLRVAHQTAAFALAVLVGSITAQQACVLPNVANAGVPQSMWGTGVIDAASVSQNGANLPWTLTANYTLISSGLYIADAPDLFQLCAHHWEDVAGTGTPAAYKRIWFQGLYMNFFSVKACVVAQVITDSISGTQDFMFNLSLADILSGSCLPTVKFPSTVNDWTYVIRNFEPGVSQNAFLRCPTTNVIPSVLHGSAFQQSVGELLPLPIDISGYIPDTYRAHFFDGTIAMDASSLSQTILPDSSHPTIGQSLCATAARRLDSYPAGYEVVFQGSISNYTVCGWLQHVGTSLVAKISDYGAPCPTNWTGSKQVDGFYTSAPPDSGSASVAASTWAVLAAAVAVVAIAMSAVRGGP